MWGAQPRQHHHKKGITAMTTPSTDADTSDFFTAMPPALVFEKTGDRWAGVVTDKSVRQQTHFDGPDKGKLKFWDDGRPMLEGVVILQVFAPSDEDDGLRTLYIRSYMHGAFRGAIRTAHQADLYTGDYIGIELSAIDKPRTKGGKGAKRFDVTVNAVSAPDELPAAPSVESGDEPPF
jgi:hypothetical protein